MNATVSTPCNARGALAAVIPDETGYSSAAIAGVATMVANAIAEARVICLSISISFCS
jgi:hypothetical protein